MTKGIGALARPDHQQNLQNSIKRRSTTLYIPLSRGEYRENTRLNAASAASCDRNRLLAYSGGRGSNMMQSHLQVKAFGSPVRPESSSRTPWKLCASACVTGAPVASSRSRCGLYRCRRSGRRRHCTDVGRSRKAARRSARRMVSQPAVTVASRKGGPNSQVLLLGVIAAGILIHRLGTWGLLDASTLLPAGLAGDY